MHPGLNRLVSESRWRMGAAKAQVLPVPVWAQPSTSRPGQGGRDGPLLNGSGGEIALLIKGLYDGVNETQLTKIHI